MARDQGARAGKAGGRRPWPREQSQGLRRNEDQSATVSAGEIGGRKREVEVESTRRGRWGTELNLCADVETRRACGQSRKSGAGTMPDWEGR